MLYFILSYSSDELIAVVFFLSHSFAFFFHPRWSSVTIKIYVICVLVTHQWYKTQDCINSVLPTVCLRPLTTRLCFRHDSCHGGGLSSDVLVCVTKMSSWSLPRVVWGGYIRYSMCKDREVDYNLMLTRKRQWFISIPPAVNYENYGVIRKACTS